MSIHQKVRSRKKANKVGRRKSFEIRHEIAVANAVKALDEAIDKTYRELIALRVYLSLAITDGDFLADARFRIDRAEKRRRSAAQRRAKRIA